MSPFNPSCISNAKCATVSVKYLHADTVRELVSAYDINEEINIILTIPRNIAAKEIVATIYDEFLSPVNECVGTWQGHSMGIDEYLFNFTPFITSASLRFFDFRIKGLQGDLYVRKSIGALISQNREEHNPFQLSVSDFEHDAPCALWGGVIYQIFVDRFNRGGDVPVSDGAKLITEEWDVIPEYPEYPGAPLKNNTFFGGTLFGITDKLDYIKSLGATAIYLSPIFSSVSNHKYDTADYMKVDEMFGGEEALKELINQAKKRNIRMILDGVFNHTGDDSVYFNKCNRFDTVGAYNSKSSPYYSWYDFQHHPDEYTSWWGIPILPRINPDIQECGEYFAGRGGVIEKYRKLGVYGFRLDVCDELSDEFIAKIKSKLSEDGESVLYGEVWEDASCKIAYEKRKKYYLGRELDGVMNYPLRTGIIDFIVKKSTDTLSYALLNVIQNMPIRIRNSQMNLLGSHDTVRVITALAGKSADGHTNAQLSVARLTDDERSLATKKLMAAYTVLATLPGIPTIFYGDEAGLEGYSDPFNRMPYPWGKEAKELVAHYRKVGNIRTKNDVYKDADFEVRYLTPELLIFERVSDKARYVTVFNNSDTAIGLCFDAEAVELLNKKRAKKHRLSDNSATIFKINNDTEFEIISEAHK